MCDGGVMKIDWKEVSKSEGYRSLKAAYIKDVQNSKKQKYPMRDKEEFLKHFNWVINRAKHYAVKKNISIIVVLNEWESKRKYWWLNYYKNCNQPKIHTNKLKHKGVRYFLKYFKEQYKHDHKRRRLRMKELIRSKKNPFNNLGGINESLYNIWTITYT